MGMARLGRACVRRRGWEGAGQQVRTGRTSITASTKLGRAKQLLHGTPHLLRVGASRTVCASLPRPRCQVGLWVWEAAGQGRWLLAAQVPGEGLVLRVAGPLLQAADR